ncbi:MAG: fimbrillin family protein [Bacteroidales bacterium]|nr:fimbrillin family protein [Bacteroidales bacterium]
MKRVIYFLSAAALTLVACNKTETIVTETPDEIGFKAVTSVATKADPDPAITGTALPSKDWIIYASALNVQNQEAYFNQTEFKTTDANEPVSAAAQYKADPSLYWPAGNAQLDILALAAREADKTTLNWTYNNASKNVDGFTITDWDVWTNQIDLLFARKNGASKETTTSLEFNHLLSLIEFKAKTNEADQLKITKIELDGLQNKGTLNFDNTKNEEVITWTLADAEAGKNEIKSIADAYLTTSYAAQGKDLLVAPQAKKNITITCTLGGNTLTYKVNTLRGLWEKGKKYIYQIEFTLGEIVFTESVIDWTENSSDYSI